jgi:sugar porter (SP) family MFS transporter
MDQPFLGSDDITKSSVPNRTWAPLRVFTIFFFPALGGLLFGYDIGATSYVSLQLQDKHDSGVSWYHFVESSTILQGAITSAGVGGAFIGSIIVFRVTNVLGTRREMLTAALLFISGAVLEAFSATKSLSANVGISVLLLGRWIYGVGCGFAMHGAPSYIAELSPPDIRGGLVSLKECMIVVGMLLGYVMGYLMQNKPNGWGITYGVSIIPAIVFFFGVMSLPSPARWLLAKGEEDKARASVMYVYSHEKTGMTIFRDMVYSAQEAETRNQGMKGKPPLFTQNNKRALVAALGVVTLQQITGQPSVLYYAAEIFASAGIESYAAVLTGCFKLLATLGSVVVVDKFGRRWLLLLGISVMFFALTMMCIAFYGYKPAGDDDDADDDDTGLTPRTAVIIVGMFLYIGGYQISFGPIAWLLISEIFALDVRDQAIAVAVQCNFGWNLAVTFLYPVIVSGLGNWLGVRHEYTAAFGIFDILTLYSIFFVYRNVPETKGLSLEQIEVLLRSPVTKVSMSHVDSDSERNNHYNANA